MLVFRNKVKVIGALRPLRYFEEFEAGKIEAPKTNFLVSLIFIT